MIISQNLMQILQIYLKKIDIFDSNYGFKNTITFLTIVTEPSTFRLLISYFENFTSDNFYKFL